jgi:hypothetical protein
VKTSAQVEAHAPESVQLRIDASRRIYAVNADPMREVDAWLDRFRAFLGTEAGPGAVFATFQIA